MPKAQNADSLLANKLLEEYKELWKNQMLSATLEVDHVKFSQLSLFAMTHYAATIAVDVGLTEEKFLGLCRESFVTIYRNAPRFS
jgi:hypothetical protein